MFAVIPPKQVKPDRFVIKTDKKEISQDSRNINQKIESKAINTAKNIIESKFSSNNFPNKVDGEIPRINLTDNLKKDEIKRNTGINAGFRYIELWEFDLQNNFEEYIDFKLKEVNCYVSI